MALTRARAVAGDRTFGTEVEQAIAEIIGLPRDPAKVAAEVRAMRGLIAQEKGDQDPWDVKLAAGGLTDIDFIAQALTLAHAATHPSLIDLPTEETINAAADADLIEQAHARVLVQTHKLLSDIFHWQRLTIEGPFEAAMVPAAILRRVANAVGRPDAATMLADLRETQREVRKIFDAVLGAG
jgi:[glutamine synthetase] adenylyltransferase / [glutamine synthetase]-adenylyl-L-tyrosine phosphorylase